MRYKAGARTVAVVSINNDKRYGGGGGGALNILRTFAARPKFADNPADTSDWRRPINLIVPDNNTGTATSAAGHDNATTRDCARGNDDGGGPVAAV